MAILPVRKNTRLKGYDYSQVGCYFVTICVKNRQKMLGQINVGAGSSRLVVPTVELTEYGIIARDWLHRIHLKYNVSKIDCYVIMPNHIHAILRLVAENGRDSPVRNGRDDPAPTTVGGIIGFYKYQTTKQINIPGFWQRSYHDHIIRNETEYVKIAEYIVNNPLLWKDDCFYQQKISTPVRVANRNYDAFPIYLW